MNAGSAITNAFTDELGNSAGSNGLLDGYFAGTDDVPLIASDTMAEGSYTVYLTNDSEDGILNLTDTNKTVTLTSVATGPNGSKATIEITVAIFDLFPPPAPITLVGPGATFAGNNSNAKELHGDDQCATDPIGVTRPVVAVSHIADVPNLQIAINGSKPDTYFARDLVGAQVTASTDPDLISTIIPASTLTIILNNYGIDLLDYNDLNELVKTVENAADYIAGGGTTSTTVYVGTPGDTQVVVVNGDFWLKDHGAGILVVTGELTFNGNIDFDGMILVIGKGSMVRNGAGNGTISGGILVANTAGLDGVPGTGDDVLGPPTFLSNGGGNSSVSYCSTAMEQALRDVPPRTVAFNHLM